MRTPTTTAAAPTPRARGGIGQIFCGTGRLLHLTVRTDTIATPIGVLVLPALLLITAASLAPLYPDAPSRHALATGSAANPIFQVLLGPLRDTSSTGTIALWRIGMFALLISAILAAATITRTLRGPESAGRTELLRAGAVGPAAPVAAATITAATATAAASTLTALAAAAVGVPTIAAALLGVQVSAAGLAGIAIAVIIDQIVTTTRTAVAASSAILVAAYIIRGIGDAAPSWSWLTWTSPLGWAEHTDPLATGSLAPPALCLALFLSAVAAATIIARRRDLGAGLIAPRPGPPTARWPITVTARTMGPALTPWLTATFAYCLLVGVLTHSVQALIGQSQTTNDLIQQLGGASPHATIDLVAALINTVLGFAAIAATAAAISVVSLLRTDDRTGRTDILLATAVTPRTRLLSAALTAATAAALVLALAAAGLWTGATLTGTPLSAGHLVITAAGQLPPTLTVAAIAATAYSLTPPLIALGWTALAIDLLLGPLAPLIAAPHWLTTIAPRAHIPATIDQPPPLAPTTILLLTTTLRISTAALTINRRDPT